MRHDIGLTLARSQCLGLRLQISCLKLDLLSEAAAYRLMSASPDSICWIAVGDSPVRAPSSTTLSWACSRNSRTCAGLDGAPRTIPSCRQDELATGLQLPARGLVDELDALAQPSDRHLIAELIKQLSDAGSKFKVLLVGIAETGSDLTNGHPSVDRCLKETRLGRMTDDELRQIIDAGRDPRFLVPDAVRDIIRESGCYARNR